MFCISAASAFASVKCRFCFEDVQQPKVFKEFNFFKPLSITKDANRNFQFDEKNEENQFLVKQVQQEKYISYESYNLTQNNLTLGT